MILCPVCASPSAVIDSRHASGVCRRRRKCKACNQRWTTYEVPASFVALAKELNKIQSVLTQSTQTLADLALLVEDYDLSPNADSLPKRGGWSYRRKK